VGGHARAQSRLSRDKLSGPAVIGPGFSTNVDGPAKLRSGRFDAERNIIVVNSAHRDFVFATRNRALQLRYLVRLYVKDLVLKNFAGLPARSNKCVPQVWRSS
jgi:hypothetical protein